MIHKKIHRILNGDHYEDFIVYTCNGCGENVPECHPHYVNKSKIFCSECAFKNSIINEKQYLKTCGVYVDGVKAAVSPIDGEIEITTNKYFSWDRPNKQQRNTKEYIEWRTNVFKRDNFTCQICGQVGRILNAHHIKSFAKYKKLRHTVSNGITLCKECHKRVHKGVVKLE